jgi:hypothetical protein
MFIPTFTAVLHAFGLSLEHFDVDFFAGLCSWLEYDIAFPKLVCESGVLKMTLAF